MSDGKILVTDESNCRILLIAPPLEHPETVLGRTGECIHDPPARFARPDSAFPTTGGGLVVTELRAQRIDLLARSGTLIRALRVRGLAAPDDAYEFAHGRLIATSDAKPGAIEELSAGGRVLWRYAPNRGPGELNHPSLARVLPGGNILVCDTGDDRILVIDRRTKQIIWQYGHDGTPGNQPGYLNTPDSAIVLP
jgi:hypothetical protein